MADIQKGETFADGQIVNAARLNNLADLATILTGFIADKDVIAPLATDYLVVFRPSDTLSLKKAPFQGGVSSIGLTMPIEFSVSLPNPITDSGTFTITKVNQDSNKVYAAPSDGSLGPPTFRVRTANDLTLAPVTIAATAIDWSLGNIFTKVLSGGSNAFTFTNMADGQVIKVLLFQPATATASWPAGIKWKGGTTPVVTTGAGRIDLFIFHRIAGVTFGQADQNYI